MQGSPGAKRIDDVKIPIPIRDSPMVRFRRPMDEFLRVFGSLMGWVGDCFYLWKLFRITFSYCFGDFGGLFFLGGKTSG